MIGQPSTLVLADSHLRGRTDPAQKAMVDFLTSHRSAQTALVVLGDFFEFLSGYNRVAEQAYRPVLQSMSGWANTHFVEGNHDFDLSQRTPGLAGWDIYGGPVRMQLGGLSCQLMHGDRCSPADYGTRMLRSALSSGPIRFARDHLLPDRLIFQFALSFANFSRSRTWPGRETESNATRERARQMLQDPQLDAVLYGHTHQHLLESSPQGILANPGSARPGGSYIEIRDRDLLLRSFPEGKLIGQQGC